MHKTDHKSFNDMWNSLGNHGNGTRGSQHRTNRWSFRSTPSQEKTTGTFERRRETFTRNGIRTTRNRVEVNGVGNREFTTNTNIELSGEEGFKFAKIVFSFIFSLIALIFSFAATNPKAFKELTRDDERDKRIKDTK